MKKLSIIICMIFIFGFNLKVNGAVFGQLVNGLPVVTVPFNDLQQNIQSAAIANGYASASLTSMEIIYENSEPVFRYFYTATSSNGEVRTFKTRIPLVLNDVFLTNGGPKPIVTCTSVNCSGCNIEGETCTPCPETGQPEMPVSCTKVVTTATSGGGGGGIQPWIGLITVVVANLLGRL